MTKTMQCSCLFCAFSVLLAFFGDSIAQEKRASIVAPTKAPFEYLQAKAFHIPPETTTEESGYFSLCEGNNGRIYIGTAAYGRNAYLVEFDPDTEQMRIVLDTHKLLGLPLNATGYAAQSKLHTRNFVGPSGKIYVGSKQGYASPSEKKELEAGRSIPEYLGGYVMAYDPQTDRSESLGMPMPLTPERRALGKKEGEGVIDVTADEGRGLVYVITCEEQHWMMYEVSSRKYRDLGVVLKDQPNTLIDASGRGTAITDKYEIARYDPATNTVTVSPLMVGAKPFADYIGPGKVHPDWRLAANGKSAYLQLLNDLCMFRIDLSGDSKAPVNAVDLGNRIDGENPDSRGSISMGPDGNVYSVIRIDNKTGYGTGYLHHLIRYDPSVHSMKDLGVITIANPDFFDFSKGPGMNDDGSPRPTHGFHHLPDGTLTPLHVVLAMIVARDGTVYATTLYPFTLMKLGRLAAPKKE